MGDHLQNYCFIVSEHGAACRGIPVHLLADETFDTLASCGYLGFSWDFNGIFMGFIKWNGIIIIIINTTNNNSN
jgi:hypothetical protein